MSTQDNFEFTISREQLMTILQPVTGVVEKRQTLPILANALFQISGKKISVTATDLEVQLTGYGELENMVSDFSVTLPAKKLMDICKGLSDDAIVNFYFENQKVKVVSGRAKFMLSTLPADDFPAVEDGPNTTEFEIRQADLCHLLQRTYFAMAQQDVRYFLNGILLEIKENKLTAVSTDGHRLALCRSPLLSNIDEPVQVILPRRGVLELMRLLTENEKTLAVTIGQNHIRLLTEKHIFTSKLVDGRFPDYNRVIPSNTHYESFIDREKFKEALNRVSILCNEKFKGIRLSFTENMICIAASNAAQEKAEEEIEVKYNAEPVEMGFNVRYLLDVLNALPGNIRLSFSDPSNSILITDEKDSLDCAYVIMPMLL